MKSERDTLKGRILNLLREFTPLHKDDIAAALGANRVSLNGKLHYLKRHGQIGKSKSAEGYWYSLEHDTECPRSESN